MTNIEIDNAQFLQDIGLVEEPVMRDGYYIHVEVGVELVVFSNRFCVSANNTVRSISFLHPLNGYRKEVHQEDDNYVLETKNGKTIYTLKRKLSTEEKEYLIKVLERSLQTR